MSQLVPSQLSIHETSQIMAVGYLFTEIVHMMKQAEKYGHRQQAESFKALGDGTRYELLTLIAKGITTTKELAEKLSISGASVTYHLQTLVEANFLHSNWRRMSLYERINQGKIQELFAELNRDLLLEETEKKKGNNRS
ncbi:MAG: winged helix-turn-helix transcriptional regulator [Clostridiales bacterium]|nr:winged helix-turn-helix transcriptional regulator [Clostridiales bacterium]